jgi:hypothetical protein
MTPSEGLKLLNEAALAERLEGPILMDVRPLMGGLPFTRRES